MLLGEFGTLKFARLRRWFVNELFRPKMQNHKATRFLRCFGVFLLASVSVLAQSRNSGEIRGTVLDSSGAVIPGAQITIQNVLTGVINRFTSDKAGVYDAESLNPGTYAV